MNFNYATGKQMVIMDPRICLSDGGRGTNIRPLAPPFCYNSWVVNPTADSTEHILDHAGAVAAGAGKLDAIHVMAHGMPGFLQIGTDDMSMNNVYHWGKLENKVKVIVLYGCQTGADVKPWQSDGGQIKSLAKGIAVLTNAKVIACKEYQHYYDTTGSLNGFQVQYGGAAATRRVETGRGGGAVSYVELSGDVYICSRDSETVTVPRSNPFDFESTSTLNLQTYIANQN
jgi:uncharacterized protein DUF4347